MLKLKVIQNITGRVDDVFAPLEMKKIWYDSKFDMYVIFEQAVEKETQSCYWYHGEVATLIFEGYIIKLNAIGDVTATLKNKKGEIIESVCDYKDSGKFKETFFAQFERDLNLSTAHIVKNLIWGPPTWQIDVYRMNDWVDRYNPLHLQLFTAETHINQLIGSYNLKSTYFSDALFEICENKQLYLEMYT